MRPTGCVNFTLNVGMRFSQQRKQNLKRESWLFFLKRHLDKNPATGPSVFSYVKGGEMRTGGGIPVWSSANLAGFVLNHSFILLNVVCTACLFFMPTISQRNGKSGG